MNKWLALGMPLPDVIKATTAAAAAALGRAGRIGVLRPGAEADLAVLTWDDGPFDYEDAGGGRRIARRRLSPLATVRAGDVRGSAG